MAVNTYNTFVVYDCKKRKVMMVTSSARKANGLLTKGIKIEVWNRNDLVEEIYVNKREKFPMKPYVDAERKYIAEKQLRHEEKNRRRTNGKRTEFKTGRI